MMRCRFAVVPRRVLVVFGGLLMVFGCLLGHESSLSIEVSRAAWPEMTVTEGAPWLITRASAECEW